MTFAIAIPLPRLLVGGWLLLASPFAAAATLLHSGFDVQVPLPPTPVTVAGTPQLVHEVHLSNVSMQPLTLTRVRVADADADGGDETLADLRGQVLEAQLGGFGPAADDVSPRTVAPGARTVLYLELAPRKKMPASLRHRIEYEYEAKQGRTSAVLAVPEIAVNAVPAVVLSSPLRGGPWAAIHHPEWKRGHRRMIYAVNGRAKIPGRFAIDFIKLDTQGRTASGDRDRSQDWYGQGEDVLAVADGVVVAARDDMSDSASVAAHPRHALADATGNYVALDIGQGRHAFYEHLQAGSVRVKAGQRVRSGDVIGRLGFTGDSSGPHLHFHVSDANSPLDAEGLPFALREFELLGGYEDLDLMGTQPWEPLEASTEAIRKQERPAPNRVVHFWR